MYSYLSVSLNQMCGWRVQMKEVDKGKDVVTHQYVNMKCFFRHRVAIMHFRSLLVKLYAQHFEGYRPRKWHTLYIRLPVRLIDFADRLFCLEPTLSMQQIFNWLRESMQSCSHFLLKPSVVSPEVNKCEVTSEYNPETTHQQISKQLYSETVLTLRQHCPQQVCVI